MGRSDDVSDLLNEGTVATGAKPKAKPKAKPAAPKAAPVAATPGSNVRGRVAGEPRGIPGLNLIEVLRRTFSKAKGSTEAEGVEAIRQATAGAKAATGKPYPEALMVGRVRKFLMVAKKANELKLISEGGPNGPRYQFTGVVSVARGRQAAEAPAPAPAPAPVAKPKRVKAAPVAASA